MYAHNRLQTRTVLLVAALVAAVIVIAGPALTGAANAPQASPPSQAPMTAIATGEAVGGVPVYRLPSITVTANRKSELAKIAREEITAQTGSNRPL